MLESTREQHKLPYIVNSLVHKEIVQNFYTRLQVKIRLKEESIFHFERRCHHRLNFNVRILDSLN